MYARLRIIRARWQVTVRVAALRVGVLVAVMRVCGANMLMGVFVATMRM